jgi:hypothetical protein
MAFEAPKTEADRKQESGVYNGEAFSRNSCLSSPRKRSARHAFVVLPGV